MSKSNYRLSAHFKDTIKELGDMLSVNDTEVIRAAVTALRALPPQKASEMIYKARKAAAERECKDLEGKIGSTETI